MQGLPKKKGEKYYAGMYTNFLLTWMMTLDAVGTWATCMPLKSCADHMLQMMDTERWIDKCRSLFAWRLHGVDAKVGPTHPETGCLLYFITYGTALTMSITTPSSVQTGSSKGVKAMAHAENGKRLNGIALRSLYPPPSVLHSVAVLYPRSYRQPLHA